MTSRGAYVHVTVPDPWQVLADTDLLLLRRPIAELGRYYHLRRAIVIRSGLLVVEERAVLWHELVHARRGDRACHLGWFDGRQERSVDREAARWAVPLPALLEALVGARSLAEVADALKTTEQLLRVRIEGLHPVERAAVQRLRDRVEEAA